MSQWKIWCDGACAPTNPGPCAWGAVIESPDGGRMEHCGFIQPMGTNNIAELTAAIESLRKVPAGAQVVLCSDSQYTLKGLGEWLPGWIRKGWRTASGSPVLNKELWQALHQEYAARKVKLEWVRGHNGHPENELADRLANRGLRR
ncbi:ribonuclease H [Acidithiobacillus ferrooxidans]|uniref:ribonuclease H n=1 Tax=Acidithiobacillus ferrooxidans (strain ATCC 23270 / DSM 14882 / CIP 104768 / NCIMB 8455) TaxID=243159 RepID=B7J8N2_ACIF2|nr:ribonuclease H [Acidithiobacillus ferrooxidans]ACK79856.1 ribonuclease HI [Acidithiobacillus ferrooxidans ATCC 23270]